MPPDNLTAALEQIKKRYDKIRTGTYPAGAALADYVADFPRLVAALEVVLELHQPIMRREGWNPTCKYDNHRWPCPEVAAITREITGKE